MPDVPTITFTDEDEDWIKVVHAKNLAARAKELGMTPDELEALEKDPPKGPVPSPEELETLIREKVAEYGLGDIIDVDALFSEEAADA